MLISDIGNISLIALVIAPVVGYIFQYKIIAENNKVGSFSIYVCAILLISNIFRIFFWLAKGFKLPLLFQSFFMIFAQLILLRICIKILKFGKI